MIRVFLSYAKADEQFASELRRALAGRGVDAFDPNTDLKPGEELSASMLDHLKQSEMLIFVVPRHEGQGKSALVELGAARALGKKIVSVLPDRVRAANNDIASALGSSYFLDAVGKNVDTLAGQVVDDLEAA